LLNRTTRSVSPNEAGARLLQRLQSAFAELDEAVGEVSMMHGVVSGTLRLNSTRVAARHYLAPLLGALLERHPKLKVDVVFNEALIDIVDGRFDAGIRLGERLAADMIALPLGGMERMMCVASPDYVRRFGAPKEPRELLSHECLNYRWPTSGGLYRWEFIENGRDFDIQVPGRIIVDDTDMLVHAAMDGLGIAYLLSDQVKEHVAAGKLVSMLEAWSPGFPGFHLYYPSRKHASPALRALISLIQERRNVGPLLSG
jgi:DNA-binding transcriptional LysR family regulator